VTATSRPPRLARISHGLSRARWPEYRRFLERARTEGYELVAVEEWVLAGVPAEGRVLVLRHDVDQHPRSALAMAAVERELGVRSTWYFRWRTAHPEVIRRLRSGGFSVGFHYETLTRLALVRGLGAEDEVSGLIEPARRRLRGEIAAFQDLHGQIRSACPHGDSRVPGVTNAVLLKGQDAADYGLEFDGNDAMRGRISYWLTDRSIPEGRWRDGVDPFEVLAEKHSPLLCLTHPNNWASGPSLWLDRLAGAALPDRPKRPIRTGGDAPPG
jgi:hypothetical protein